MLNRIQWLDVAKGITIILMVMGHSSIPKWMSDFIFTFHMPFFFLASGYCSKFSKDRYGFFVLRKLQTIILPFTIYSLITTPLRTISSDKNLLEYTFCVLTNGWMGVPLWFVPVLFMALLLAGAVFIVKNKYVRLSLYIILPIISAILRRLDIYLPWDISAVPAAAFFVMTGQYLNAYKYKFTFLAHKKLLVITFSFIVTALISHFYRLDMCWNDVIPLFPKLIGAISGSVMVSVFSMLVVELMPKCTKVLTSIGKETFVILAFADLIIELLNYYFDLNFIIKYLLMSLILVVIVYLKRVIVSLAKTGKISFK